MKVKTPSWSGKAEEAAMYLTKFKAMCECSGFGDAIVPGVTLMSGAQYNSATDKTTDNCNYSRRIKRPVQFISWDKKVLMEW